MVTKSGLSVAEVLADFIEGEVLPGTGVDAQAFWDGLSGLVDDFAGKNRALVETREELQR